MGADDRYSTGWVRLYTFQHIKQQRGVSLTRFNSVRLQRSQVKSSQAGGLYFSFQILCNKHERQRMSRSEVGYTANCKEPPSIFPASPFSDSSELRKKHPEWWRVGGHERGRSHPLVFQPMEMSWHQGSGTGDSQTRNTPHRLASIDQDKKAGSIRNVPGISQCLRAILLRQSEELCSFELEIHSTLALHWMRDDFKLMQERNK